MADSLPDSGLASKSSIDDQGVAAPQRDVEALGEKSDGNVGTLNPREGMPQWKWVATITGLYLAALLYGLDTTIAADVQASVYESLGDIKNLPWVGLGFPMASVAVILFVGRAYGLFEVKALTIVSLIIFEVGSALCGAAPTSNALIVGRVIAGMGGAGMYLGALTYISSFTTNSEASLYNALIGLAWGVGAILGPVIGGAFSDSKASWRWAFYINLPLAGLFSPVYLFILPTRNPRPDLTVRQKFAQIDWVGSVLNGAIFVLFMIVVTFGGSTYAWNSGSSIALWVVFGACLIAFILQQRLALFTTKENRIFPVEFLKSRTMLLLYIATGAAASANAVTLYYIPLFFQFTRGDSALKAAVRLLPFIVIFVVSVMIAGGTLPAVGRYQIYYVLGGALALAGSAAMFTIDASTGIARIYGYEVLIAAGTGLVFQNAYAVAAAKVARRDAAKAIGFVNVAQIGTIAIALAIAGSLFQNLGFDALKSAFAGYGYADEYVRSALAGSISPVFKSADPQVVHIAVTTVATTIQRVFGTAVAAGAVMLVSGLLMRWEKLDLDMAAGG